MKRILVVDDDPTIRELLSIRFEKKGYTVDTASDGVEALAVARESKPDLIVLDVSMPNMDGYSFVREVRWKEELKSVPILIVTAYLKTEKLFHESKGVAKFISKPFDSNKLLDIVEDCIGVA